MLYDYSHVYAGMDSTVEYIARLLSVNPSLRILEATEEEAVPIELETEIENIDFLEIEYKKADCRVGAVDSGQGTIVRNNVFQAAVYRAGFLIFKGRRRIEEYSEPLLMVNLTRGNYSQIYEEAFLQCHKNYPPEMPEFGEILGALRRLSEESAIFKCLDDLGAGDLVLLDGALRSDGYGFMESLLQTAAEKEISIASVAKSSNLLWRGGASLGAVLKSRGDGLRAGASWYTRAGVTGLSTDKKPAIDIYMAKLNPKSAMTFRVDLSRLNARKAPEIFAALSEYSTDPFFLGYPYPLAAVHQMVRLSRDELYGFMRRLQDLALRRGVEHAAWDLLFGDYHAVLNFDLPETKLIHQ